MNIHTQNVSRRNIYSFAVNNTLEQNVNGSNILEQNNITLQLIENEGEEDVYYIYQ
ncbi:deoxyribodipyrimidine photolyase-related protein [Saudi moumouvirus]|nr:deoxyribodipyrimidine photolyase-related protein [Saudi moumouvirus]